MTKKAIVLKLMKRRWISPLDALRFAHCLSLSQRAGELRREGHNVISRRPKGKPYSEYRIA